MAPKRRKGPESKTLLTTAKDTEGTRVVLEEMDPTIALMAGTKGKKTTLEARVVNKEREAPPKGAVQEAGQEEKKPSKMCHHCKKPGHMKSECWKLHPELAPKRRKGPEGKTLLTMVDDKEETRLVLEEVDPILALMVRTLPKGVVTGRTNAPMTSERLA